jgi:hypothetical protein
MVAFESCALPLHRSGVGSKVVPTTYATDFTNPWYALAGNHQDSTCKNGDGAQSAGDDDDASQHPCQWYQAMVQRSLARGRGPPPSSSSALSSMVIEAALAAGANSHR